MTSNTATHYLSGLVRNQGLPVAGITVALYDAQEVGSLAAKLGGEFVQQTRTDQRGEFNFSVSSGRYRIEVVPAPDTRFLRQSALVSVINQNTSCNINLGTGMFINGTLRTSGGAGLSYAQIAIIGIDPATYHDIATTDASGKFNVTLPRGRYHFGFRAQRTTQAKIEDLPLSKAFFANRIEIVDVQSDDTIDLVLPRFVKLAGDVIDSSGRPVPDARVEVSSAEPQDRILALELGLTATCLTDEKGHFEVNVEPCAVDVRVEPPAGTGLFGLRELNLNALKEVTKKFVLAEGYRLRGQVLYEDQQLPNCLVRVQGTEKLIEVMARTDERGQFCVNVPSGNYKLVVMAHPKDVPAVTIDGAEFSGVAPWARMVVVGRDTHVAVRLQQGTPVQGIVAEPSGKPKENARVSLFADPGGPLTTEKLEHALNSTVSNTDGNYLLYASPGSYWLAVDSDLANATHIEVAADPVRFQLVWRGVCQAKLEILSHDEHHLSRCRVVFAPYRTTPEELDTLVEEAPPGSSRGCSLTDEFGVCELWLPPNVYTFRVTPPPETNFEVKQIKQVSISSDWTRTLKLNPKPPKS